MRKFLAIPVSKSTFLRSLDVIKVLLVLILVLMFIGFNKEVAKQTAVTQKIAENTNKVVNSQGDILNAIKKVTEDTHTTAADQTSIIICMLQVPVYQRTIDLQSQCRKAVAASISGSGSQTAQNSIGTSNQKTTSPQPTPATTSTQANTSQKTAIKNTPTPTTPAAPSVLNQFIINPIKSIVNAL